MAQLAIEAAEKGDYSLIRCIFIKTISRTRKYSKWFIKDLTGLEKKLVVHMLSCSS
jgi:hypothetical protein